MPETRAEGAMGKAPGSRAKATDLSGGSRRRKEPGGSAPT